MINFFAKTKSAFIGHKILGSISILVIVYGSYLIYTKFFNSTASQELYTVDKVTKETIVNTITGTGQISSSNQVDLKAKASGPIVKINYKTGDNVKAGAIIMSLDTRDALIDLESARIAFQKATKGANNLTLLQAQNNLNNSKEDNIKTYDDAFTKITSALSTIDNTFTDFDVIFNSSNGYLGEQNTFALGITVRDSRKVIQTNYWKAIKAYDTASTYFKSITRASDKNNIVTALSETESALRLLSEVLKNSKATAILIKAEKNKLDSTDSTTTDTLDTLDSNINSTLETILQTQNSIKSSERGVTENETSLADVQDGNDPLDIQSAQLTYLQKQNSYENYFIKAPFDGVVAKTSVNLTNDVSSGTTVATLITKQKIAQISLNEVDIAKIKSGQKVNITFDAIEDLNMTGQVLDVDLVGTVSQGVVSYNVKIGLDIDDDRIKSGMSVSASIITDVRQDVVSIPVTAIKSQGSQSYVEVLPTILAESLIGQSLVQTDKPIQKNITTGLTNDSMAEVLTGLNEGDQIITKTTKATAQTTKTTTPSITSSLFGGRSSGGASTRAITGR